eukprot:5387266-Prymnesium_polylepis.2
MNTLCLRRRRRAARTSRAASLRGGATREPRFPWRTACATLQLGVRLRSSQGYPSAHPAWDQSPARSRGRASAAASRRSNVLCPLQC